MTRPRKRLSIVERRAQLLGAARALFTTKPFDEVAIEDIAEAADISASLIYHYFGGKRELYAAVIETGAHELLAAIESGTEVSPLARLRAGLDSFLAYAQDNSDAYLALIRSGIGGGDQGAAVALKATRERLTELVLETFPAEARSGPRAKLVTTAWFGAVDATIAAWLADNDYDRKQLIEFLLELLTAMETSVADTTSAH